VRLFPAVGTLNRTFLLSPPFTIAASVPASSGFLIFRTVTPQYLVLAVS
jgi:hypothetical protein